VFQVALHTDHAATRLLDQSDGLVEVLLGRHGGGDRRHLPADVETDDFRALPPATRHENAPAHVLRQ